jgi:hypothetical protein
MRAGGGGQEDQRGTVLGHFVSLPSWVIDEP